MRLTDKILFEAGLTELQITTKNELGSGTEHRVFPFLKNGDAVIKTEKVPNVSSGSLERYMDAFRQAPWLVARVLKNGPGYLVIEKLDTERVKAENEMMVNALRRLGLKYLQLRPDYYLNKGEAVSFLAKTARGKTDIITLDMLEQDLGHGETAEVWARWRKLIEKAVSVGLSDDLHSGNIGYAKDGTLRLLDV